MGWREDCQVNDELAREHVEQALQAWNETCQQASDAALVGPLYDKANWDGESMMPLAIVKGEMIRREQAAGKSIAPWSGPVKPHEFEGLNEQEMQEHLAGGSPTA